MEAHSNQFILAAIFLLLLVSSSRAATAPSKLVDDICKATNRPRTPYHVCVDALAMDPASASANLKKLAGVTIQLGIENVTDGQNLINQLLKKATAPNMVKALNSCSESYIAVKASFNSAYLEVDEDIASANYDVLTAADDAANCETQINTNNV